MTTVDPFAPSPIVFGRFRDTNDQWDFTEFILFLISNSHLKDGDFLIVDNCKLHCAVETFPLISTILRQNGITLMFLPKYSPELNPCELVFSKMKSYLRYQRGSEDFSTEIIQSALTLTFKMMFDFYMKCICFD